MADDGKLSFEEARARLRARGYLDRGVEGAVLKGALAARGRAAALVRAAAVAALLLAAALAAAATVLLGVRSALGARDLAILFGYLLGGALVAAAALSGLLVAVAAWRLRSRADAEAVSTEIGAAFGLLAGVGAVLAARPALEAAGVAAALAVVAAAAATVFLAVHVARGVAFAVLLAQGRAALADPRRAGRAALVLAALVVLAAGALALRRPPAAAEPLVVAANTRRVVVVGVDGWADLNGGAAPLPGFAHPYRKGPTDPAAFWTCVATGESAARHGVGSLDLVRLAGMSEPLRPLAGTDWYLGGLLPRLSLSRRESATAAARRVPAAWEVAARGGIPALVVNWWTTYPAGETGATVLSNHLFFAARAGASLAGEGWPADATARAAALVPRGVPRGEGAERLIADAEGLDAFAIAAFDEERGRGAPRLALVYLPGPDILGAALAQEERTTAERVALAEALTRETARIARFLARPELADSVDLLVLVLDGGRGERSGSVRLAGPLAKAGAASVRPEDVAPTVLAVLGVPAARELTGRVREDLLAAGATTGATVATWGRRAATGAPDLDPRAYVENLRSLGYLR